MGHLVGLTGLIVTGTELRKNAQIFSLKGNTLKGFSVAHFLRKKSIRMGKDYFGACQIMPISGWLCLNLWL